MSGHKILIELDEQCIDKLRELSQDCGKSMQEIAGGMVTQHLLNHIVADKRYEEQK